MFRPADARDADRVAALHADSWRRYYRGAFSDAFLDGDLEADRRSVWSARLAAPTNSVTILAEHDGRLMGFVHVMFDQNPTWGSFIDNLHVVHDQRRTGIGTDLMGRAAQAVVEQATGTAMCLWVLEQNTSAQRFYLKCGAVRAETAPVSPPGGDPSRLHGTPNGLRMTWPDVTEWPPRNR